MKIILMGALALAVTAFYIEPAMSSEKKLSGGALFEEHCAACHAGDEGLSERKAPPVVAVKNHYTSVYQNKAEFSDALVRWVKAPSADYSLMPGAINRFKLMPAIDLEESVVRDIAEFIYEGKLDVPGWYQQHYREEHGQDPK